jgi:hypothetical protein
MKTILHRELHPTAKVIDATAGIVEYTASDETLDCHREIVLASGWRFTRFQKNAPFVDSHDYSTIRNLLGKVITFRVEGNALIERVQYSLEPDTLALWAFKMVRDGFLKAVSVGFQPVRAVSKWDTNPGAFMAAIAAQKLDAQTAAAVHVIYQEQEQIELSQCVLGANPNALAKAYKAGCLTEQDIDNFSTQLAKAKTVSPTADPADVEATRRRARLAILMEIQNSI